jgi:hypothetical protein
VSTIRRYTTIGEQLAKGKHSSGFRANARAAQRKPAGAETRKF